MSSKINTSQPQNFAQTSKAHAKRAQQKLASKRSLLAKQEDGKRATFAQKMEAREDMRHQSGLRENLDAVATQQDRQDLKTMDSRSLDRRDDARHTSQNLEEQRSDINPDAESTDTLQHDRPDQLAEHATLKKEERALNTLPTEALAVNELDSNHQVQQGTAEVEQSSMPKDVEQIQALTEMLVKECRLGEGKQMAKRVMLLDLSVPGKGDVRVRVMRDGDGVQVRFRAADKQTAQWLHDHKEKLRDQGHQRGVVFKRIEVV